jgi:Pyruvate/2-oxoacid:ferredoxin oxidoreductase gamma subunit
MVELGLLGIPEADVLAALDDSFAEKPALVERNRKVYAAARAWAMEHLA